MNPIRRLLMFGIAAILSLAHSANAQWERLYPDLPPDPINDILFINQSKGFAVNQAGSVLMTTDGGASWKIQAHFPHNSYHEIQFADSMNGFAIATSTVVLPLSSNSSLGPAATFIYTTDGGVHWNSGDVSMGDAKTFLPVSKQVLLKSYVSGIGRLDNFFGMWTKTYAMPMFMYGDVGSPYGSILKFQRLPSGRILALGSSDVAKRAGEIADSVSFFLKSDDQGVTWDTLWCGTPYSSRTFFFADDSLGWLCQSGRIYKTSDGGKSWTLRYLDSSRTFIISSISSPDGVHVFAADGGGRIIVSSNAGEDWTWTQRDAFPMKIYFLSASKGLLSTTASFFRTNDGGGTWSRVSASLAGDLKKIDFVSPTLGMGVGGHCIYKTLDGGKSWSIVRESPSESFEGLDMIDSLHVWATGMDTVYRSMDGGRSWSGFTLGSSVESVRGVQFLNPQVGVLYEVHHRDTTFNYVTLDSGATWTRHAINSRSFISSFFKVKFTDPAHLWFSNQDGVWLSRDTAKTWTLFPIDGAFNAFDFADSLQGWCSIWGGQFRKMGVTVDGGKTWETVDMPYSSQSQDLLTFNDHGLLRMYASGIFGSLMWFTKGDPYVYDIPTYTVQALNSFASYRSGNALDLWLGGDGMNVLHTRIFVAGVKDEGHEAPQSYSLSQNFPNPFNPSTRISYSVPQSGPVSLKIYDVLGREVTTLVERFQAAGTYTADFNAAGLAAGVYIYRLKAGAFVQAKKMILAK